MISVRLRAGPICCPFSRPEWGTEMTLAPWPSQAPGTGPQTRSQDDATDAVSAGLSERGLAPAWMCAGSRVRCGLTVRMVGFHPIDPGSIPGIGIFCLGARLARDSPLSHTHTHTHSQKLSSFTPPRRVGPLRSPAAGPGPARRLLLWTTIAQVYPSRDINTTYILFLVSSSLLL